MTNAFSSYSAIVVDDEPLPRSHLVHLLREAGLTDISQAANGQECIELLKSSVDLPDWAFIDIQLPDIDGLSLADELGKVYPGGMPAITFVTGFEDYAVQAFDRAAIDYLLKPVSRDRLNVTLNRLAAHTAADPNSLNLPSALQAQSQNQRLPIRVNYAVHLVEVEKILAAYAHDKRVEIITTDSAYSTYYSLSELEQRLPPSIFLRVHDSWMVNVASIAEIHNLGGQTYEIRLRGFDKLVPVSRRRLSQLEQRLGM